MKFKKIMLVTLVLLAVLTIGAVSASDNTDFNETLTVDIAEEVSADASLDENDVSDGGDVIAASEIDDVICDGNSTSGSGDVNPIFDGNSTKLNPGMNVNVEDTEYGEPVEVEITFDNLDSGEVSASVDGFNYAVNIVNGSGSLNICNLNIGSYILEVAYAGDDTYYATMVTAQFSVLPGENSTGENGTGIIINGDDRFVYEYEAHESSSKGDDEVLRVRWDDVDGGTLTLTVRGDYITKTFDADIDGKNEYSWTLNDLGLENYGVYRFTLTYNDNVTIFSGLPFQLMWCNVEEYKDEDVYVDYPFDVIRIYEQPNTLELYVDDNENPSQPGNKQSSTFWYPTVWNLGELGITSPGEYNILIKAYEDENLIETFSMTLNVIGFDENEYRIFTNYEGVHDFDGDAPVVYLYCPEDAEGNISVYVNDNFVGNFANDAGNMISWTLSDLGIDQNGDYSIVVKEGSDDEIAQTDLNICHLGNGNNNDINLWVNTEDEFSTNPEDLPTIFAAVNVPEGTEGNVTFTIDGNVLYNLALSGFYDGRIDHENNIYNIALEVDGDFIFEGLNSEDVVKFAFLDENGDEVTSKEYMIFFGDNTVRFEENDNGNGEDNQIGVDIWDENDERGTLYTDSEGDVVGIYVPRDYEGTVFRIYVNGNETVSWEAEFDGDNQGEYKAWGLEELGISEAGDYNIVVESDNGEGREILSNTTITVSEFNEDTYRAMILYAREVIKFYTPQNGEGTITINTKNERGDDDYEEVFDETYEITDEYRGNWKEFALADIGFEADGAFRIFTITVNNATGDEVYSYRISHVGGEEEPNGDWYEEKVEFGFNGPDDEPIEFNKTSDVLVAWLYIPDGIEHEDFADVSATVYIILNGEIIKTVRTSDFTEPLDWPNHYPIIMDLTHLQDRDQLSFRVDAIHENTSESAISEDEEERMVIIEDKGDYVIFHDDVDLERLEFDVFRGNLTLGTTNDPDLMGVIKYNLVIITISDSLGITEGTITVSDGESTVFTRQLSEFEKEYDYGSDGYTYYLSLDEVKDILPEGVNLTVSFNYADNTLAQKRIRFEDYLYSIVTVEDINNQFQFEVQDDLMLHENDTAIYLNTNTNRQAIYFDLGGGYFTVYVNGVKVENLGRVSFNTWMNKEYWRDDDDDYIERFNYDEEAFLNYVASYWGSELELFRLTSWNQGAPEIEITLADLGINESGTYNIRITHYPSVPGGLDDHSSLGVESIYAGEMLIPTVTEVLNTNITCNFDPDYAGVNIYPVTLYGNGIPFLFTFNFGDNIISESNSVLIYVDGELAFNSTILYYDENDEGEMELCNLWIVGPEMLSEDLFDECGYLAVGEYEAVVYLVKGDDAPVEIGRGNFSRIKQRGNMSFTIGSSVEGDGVHTIIYADIPEGDWTDYTLEIVIADSERVYSKGGGLYDYWFNEYVIFKDNQIYFKDSLENVIGKGPVAIDLGVLDEGTHIFVALEHGEETVFGDWDFYHYCFAVSNSNASAPLVDCNLTVEAADVVSGEEAVVIVTVPSDATGEITINLNGIQFTNTVADGQAVFNIPALNAGTYTVIATYSGDEKYAEAQANKTFTVSEPAKVDPMLNFTIDTVVYPNDLVINIAAPSDATGIVYVNILGKSYSITLLNGEGSIYVSGLSAGNYTIIADYTGDDKYNNYSYEINTGVLKADSSISLTDVVFTYGESGSSTITAVNTTVRGDGITILDAQGNVIANGHSQTLENDTEDMSDATVTLKDGVITISGLAAGEYTLKVVSESNKNYNAAEANATIIVNKANLTVSVDDIVFNYGESGTGNVVYDSKLIAVASIVNHTVVIPTINNGVVTVSSLDAGEYTLEVTVFGDNNHNSAKATSRVTVNKVASSVDVSDVIFDYGSSGEATVVLNGADNFTASVVDCDANVVIDGNKITVSGLNASTYTLKVVTVPDKNHNAAEVNATITINKVNSTITVNDVVSEYGQAVVVPIKVSGATGVNASVVECPDVEISYLNSEISISGLAVGNYTLNVTTIPDKNHIAVVANAKITVNKAYSTVSLTDIVFDYGAAGNSSVTFTGATGVTARVIDHDEIIVSVEGDVIAVSGLDAGEYTLAVVTIPDAGYEAAEATANITVNKINSTISVEDVVIDYGAAAVIPVRADGITSINASITEYPDAVIDYSDDYTIIVSGLNGGSYTLNVVGVPDKNHYASQDSATITVNKVNSTVSLTDVVFDYGGAGNSSVTFTGATGVTARVIDHDEAIVSVEGNVITVSGLDAGEYTLAVVTVPDADHSAAEASANITVNKVDSTIAVNDAVFRYGESVVIPVSAGGAEAINAIVVGYPDVEINYLGDKIVISGLAVGNYTLSVATVPDKNHNSAKTTAKITVNRVIVTSANLNEYFNENGELIGDFSELIFAGDFADKQFNINKPVKLIGENAKFSNVQFNIRADNVSIMNMELNYQGAKSIIDVDGVSNFTLENNTIVYSTAAVKASAISVRNSNEVNIKDNNIKASGSTFVDGILISDSNFTIDSNKINVNSGVDAQGINIIGSGNGNVKNNDVNVVANRTVYGMNTTTTNIIVQLNIIFIFNVIYGEGTIAVGINDDSEIIDNNKVTLKAVQATGVIVNSEDAKITNNDITLISADSDQQDPSLESTATGVQVNTKATVSYNNIDSFDQSVSVEGGCATEVSYNNVNAPMSVSAAGTSLIGNDIGTDKDKAIYISDKAVDTIVDDNVLAANGAKGNDAVSNEGTSTTISNNKAKPLLSIDSIADIFEGQSVVIVIKADNNFTETVKVQVGNYNTTASLINGIGNVTVGADKLSVGEVLVKVNFNGNENYTEDRANTTFNVKAQVATAIKATAVTITYGTSKNIVITLTDANGNAISGKEVTVDFNGVKKPLTTNDKGQVSYAIGTKLDPKTYTATITFGGDEGYVKSTGYVKVVVNKANSVLTAKQKTFKVKKAKKYTVTLKSGKTAIKKVKVTITGKFKGKKIKITKKTNNKGKVTFNLKKLTKKGKFAATVKFAGNKYYKATSKKVKITVKK